MGHKQRKNKRGGNRSKGQDSSYYSIKKKKKCDVLWIIGIKTDRQTLLELKVEQPATVVLWVLSNVQISEWSSKSGLQSSSHY